LLFDDYIAAKTLARAKRAMHAEIVTILGVTLGESMLLGSPAPA
jgi:hypothetical protein